LDADRPGGHARTIAEDGFIVEGGPNGFLDREPETRALVRAVGLESQLVEARPEAKRRFIVRNRRLCRVPESPPALVTSDALSFGAKWRLLGELFASGPPAGVDETVYDFARRRIGAEAAEMLVDAAVAGISAGDSRALSVRSQFPIMVEMERDHGSLIRAMLARRKSRTGPAKLYSFAGGMKTLIDGVTTNLGACVRAQTAVRSIEKRAGRWIVTTDHGEAIDADHVVLAVAARAAAPLVRDCDPALADALMTIPYSSVNLVALAYRTTDIPRALDGYGYLVTRPEGLSTLGVVWESSLFPGRAPEGLALLRVFLGGARKPAAAALDRDGAVALARAELQEVMGIAAAPARTWTFHWPAAIAQYNVGHADRIAAIRARLAANPGLDVCGTSYDGVSFNQAIASGTRMGRSIALSAGVEAAA
jgi:oxygen-dependent protoporphyrinogen oxidase